MNTCDTVHIFFLKINNVCQHLHLILFTIALFLFTGLSKFEKVDGIFAGKILHIRQYWQQRRKIELVESFLYPG